MNEDESNLSIEANDSEEDSDDTITIGEQYQKSYDNYMSMYGNITLNMPHTTTGGYSLGAYGAGAIGATGTYTIAQNAWTSPYYNSSIGAGFNAGSAGTITLVGADADIIIGDKSMVSWMESVNARLSILEPKKELLEKYDALKQAYEHYKTLEALLHGTENNEQL